MVAERNSSIRLNETPVLTEIEFVIE